MITLQILFSKIKQMKITGILEIISIFNRNLFTLQLITSNKLFKPNYINDSLRLLLLIMTKN